ncbi:MAG: regulatory protein RecX [Chthoniobacterales bacterium]
MREPAKIANEQALYTAALRALARRSHSVFEMRGYLEKRAAESAAAKEVLARLRESRLLDDARYAAEFARLRARVRRQGRYRIARELRARGVADQHIDAALEQAFADVDERATVRTVIERRMRAARNSAFDSKRAASLYRTLLRSGFDADLIRRELKSALHDAAAELPTIEQNETLE